MQFLCTFRKTWWLSMLRRTFSKEQMRCRGCFFEETKAIGVEKMHQILTEIDKNTKKSNFENYMQLCVILQSLGGYEFQRRSTRYKMVVRKAF